MKITSKERIKRSNDRNNRCKGLRTKAVKPDYVVLTLSIEAKNTDYNAAMQKATYQIEQLQAAIMEIGYEKSDLKTTSFDVSSAYENQKDRY